jgi:hypothetical protein
MPNPGAVSLQDRLGGNPAFPNFGAHLPVLAREQLASITSLARLNSAPCAQPLSTVMSERTAYGVAGSLVGFLREPYGVSPFRKLYETGTYDEGCGQSLDMAETEWRASLQRR